MISYLIPWADISKTTLNITSGHRHPFHRPDSNLTGTIQLDRDFCFAIFKVPLIQGLQCIPLQKGCGLACVHATFVKIDSVLSDKFVGIYWSDHVIFFF